MKKYLLLLLAVSCAALSAQKAYPIQAVSPRSVSLGKRTVTLMSAGKVMFQLYVPAKSSAHIRKRAGRFAELLSEITGSKINIVSKLPEMPQTAVLRFGDSEFAKAQKIDLGKLDRDGFVVAAFGNHILLAGKDALAADEGEGTVFGAFDFLERFADVRFYFPGKYGTLLPRRKTWSVPAMTVYDRPDSQYRRIWWGKSQWYDPALNSVQALDEHARELRFSNKTLPNCHGLAYYGYVQRFLKTKPEYFATRIDGSRADGSVVRDPSDAHGHLCFSSGIMEEIYQDAKAILTGPEAVRKRKMTGSKWWMTNTKPFFNMMPNDSMVRCRCKKCAPYHEGLNVASGFSEKAADFTWEKMLSIPNRLKKENVPGIVTMMAYDLCREIPKQKIPDNVLMQLAVFGPWGELDTARQLKDRQRMEQWVKKLGFKIYLWNYATKAAARNVPYVPNFTPRAIGRYYKSVREYSFGTFLESGTDYWIFSHLNNYMFSRLMWNSDTDPEALLDDYRKRMFGPGAAPMKDFMETLERHWIKDIINNVVETSVGPVVRPPAEYKIWNTIYSPKEVKRINGLFDKAERLAVRDKEALGRIKFIRKALWGPLNDASADYFKKAAAVEEWQTWAGKLQPGETLVIDGKGDEKAWQKAPFAALLPLGKNEAEVQTFVKMLYDRENLYFLFDCREPMTDRMLRKKRPFDDPNMWADNAVEIHLDPAGTRKEDYQLMIDSYGGITDLRITNKPLKHDLKWHSGAEAKSTVVPGKGWFAEVRVPLKSMPAVNNNRIVANFNRHRILNGVKVLKFYVWSPYAKFFGDQPNFGFLYLGRNEKTNMVTDGDFLHSGIKHSPKSSWGYWGPMPKRDTRCFRTGGVSLMLEGHRCGMHHVIENLKPDTAYRLSFFVRQENVQLNKGHGPMGSGFYVRVDDGNGVVRLFPARAFFGTIPWTRWEFSYKTSSKKTGTNYKPYIHFVLRNASGKVWVDHVELIEVDQKK